MNLWSIPPETPFLPAIATDWLARADDDPMSVARGLILLPTRRSARALAETFLAVAGGRSLLLPRIVAIGAIDETPLSLAGSLTLPDAVDPMRRLAELTRLILAMCGRHGAPRYADRAWLLAAELARLMDEAELAGVDLSRALPAIPAGDLAAHWQVTLDFLTIVTHHWPDWLAANGLANPARRRVALIDAQTSAWEREAPTEPILAAGITQAIPAVAQLLHCVARLSHGRVVLAGLDHALDENSWNTLERSHPQSGLRGLLAAMNARRDDVRPWPGTPPPGHRAQLLSRALRPIGSFTPLDAPAVGDPALTQLRPADAQEEALSIALRLRHGLEQPGTRVALVTPDRDLAVRVATELLRWGIIADDSAGEPLCETPPAVFLRLLAQAIVENFAPVPLLALLKHPLFAAGLRPAAARDAARTLELACLRGPRPGAGVSGVRRALDAAKRPPQAAYDLLERLTQATEPALRVMAGVVVEPAQAFAALIQTAEALCRTDEQAGHVRLWALAEGEALAAALAAAQEALPALPAQPSDAIPGLLDAVLQGQVVRSRRALRGRAGVEHPRVSIWGLLEARLQSVDLIVLGGLVEGVWPPMVDPGPWMSRPMRSSAGLPSPEERVGEAAHDFVMAACAAPQAVLSYARRRDGAPTVPSRWLTRLLAVLADGVQDDSTIGWAGLLDLPQDPPQPVAKPRPRPPLSRRPRTLSVTEIETWLADPYAIYARHILRLRPLDPIEQSADAADFGSLVHDALHRFLSETMTAWRPDTGERLREVMLRVLDTAGLRPAVQAWWEPRLMRIADWVVGEEAHRRASHTLDAVACELSGRWTLDVPGGFTLTGRADRLERRTGGAMALLDYKTGTPPSQTAVDTGAAPQLPLEAAMAAAGAFGEAWRGTVAELTYWHLSGGAQPGEASMLFRKDPSTAQDAIAVAAQKLRDLVQQFDDPSRPYLAQPHPGRKPRFPDYGRLARVAEWLESEDDD